MRFKCKYLSAIPVDGKRIERFTTIDADTLPEADKIARRYAGRKWVVASVKQQMEYTA